MEAHLAFDVHWEFGGCTRSEAYAWLARRLNMKQEDCHIGMFDEEQCMQAIEVCRKSSPARDAAIATLKPRWRGDLQAKDPC